MKQTRATIFAEGIALLGQNRVSETASMAMHVTYLRPKVLERQGNDEDSCNYSNLFRTSGERQKRCAVDFKCNNQLAGASLSCMN